MLIMLPGLPEARVGLCSVGAFGAMLLSLAACDGDVIHDDYNESSAVIRGVVHEPAVPAVAGAQVEFSADTPQYLAGDVVTTDSEGAFLARVTSFGVGTFTASVRMRVRRTATAPVALDTLLSGIQVIEHRGGAQPDTVDLTIELAAP